MGLTDFTRYSDDPVGDAMTGIYNHRLRESVQHRVFGSQYDPTVKPVPIWTCLRYLKMIGKDGWDCTCRAYQYPERRHSQDCGVTPDYAAVAKQLDMAPELACGAIAMSMWYLNWDDWDTTKYQIKSLEGGQEFPYGE